MTAHERRSTAFGTSKQVVMAVNPSWAMRQDGIQDILWELTPEVSRILNCNVRMFISATTDDIRGADVVVADIYQSHPTAMIAVGAAEALGKPIIMMAGDVGEVPHLAHHRVILWDGQPSAVGGSPVHQARAALKMALVELLSALPHVEAPPVAPSRMKLFVSYSHCDADYLARLRIHLRPLEQLGLLDLWSDTKIRPGDRWKDEIAMALDLARVAVLLISADFIASDFIRDNELPPLLRAAETKGTRIVPIVLKPSRFTRHESLSVFQALNDPDQPVINMSEFERESLYDKLAKTIELEILSQRER